MSGAKLDGEGQKSNYGDLTHLYQSALRGMDEVMAVNILGNGRIKVLARGGKSPQVLARDIKTILLTTTGHSVETSSIEVVQVSAEQGTSLKDFRIRVGSIALDRRGHKVTGQITLQFGERENTGKAVSNGGTRQEETVLALATVRAVEKLLGGSVRLDISAIQGHQAAGQDMEIALIEWMTTHESVSLLGASLVRRSRPEAVVGAVLDALNRHVSWFSA